MSLIKMHQSPGRFAAWLGLCAILLLFIAPAISKSLALSSASHSGMMMDDDMHEMPTMSPAEHARMMMEHPLSMMDDSACGYCVLLAHLPLDLTSLPPLWSALQAARQPVPPRFQIAIPRLVAHFFHPRAPPTERFTAF
ncbi:DUF2946 domain-containing protein [Erwinia oleae]|uniref:DUF2946 domain-containing protein n=1 Tax=Erwinia oleae TaxID=796334 RepID=UPI000A604F17|nr:DUF2946 domain-containing protein [Erwinia oleae]